MNRREKSSKPGDFADLGLNPWLTRQCSTIGLTSPTPVQKNCIPKILSGSDCVACAKTGSGKTLAFVLPILQKLSEDPFGIFALILSPTRELCFQIKDQIAVLGSGINIRLCTITGGMDMITQARELQKKPHVVVATPGRLADHIESCDTFSLKNLRFLVLDEADRLFNGRFNAQMKTILDALPKQKQTLLFSATMTQTLEQVKHVTHNKVFVWKCSEEVTTVEKLEQYYVLCPSHARNGYLVETIRSFLAENPDSSVMVFTDTCKNCQVISMALNEIGMENAPLHSMISQKERLLSLQRFKSESARILIATDVASRGLDIPMVDLVVNHIMPNNPTDYIHRVGRTARAGRIGSAISLITQYEISLLRSVEERINQKFKEYDVSGKEVAKVLTQVNVTVREMQVKLEETDFEEKRLINKRKNLIRMGYDPDELEELLKKKKKRRRKGKKDL